MRSNVEWLLKNISKTADRPHTELQVAHVELGRIRFLFLFPFFPLIDTASHKKNKHVSILEKVAYDIFRKFKNYAFSQEQNKFFFSHNKIKKVQKITEVAVRD